MDTGHNGHSKGSISKGQYLNKDIGHIAHHHLWLSALVFDSYILFPWNEENFLAPIWSFGMLPSIHLYSSNLSCFKPYLFSCSLSSPPYFNTKPLEPKILCLVRVFRARSSSRLLSGVVMYHWLVLAVSLWLSQTRGPAITNGGIVTTRRVMMYCCIPPHTQSSQL